MGGVKHPYFIPLNPGTQLGISMAGVHSMKMGTLEAFKEDMTFQY